MKAKKMKSAKVKVPRAMRSVWLVCSPDGVAMAFPTRRRALHFAKYDVGSLVVGPYVLAERRRNR